MSKSASVLVRAVSSLFKEFTLHSLEIATTGHLLTATIILTILVVLSWLVALVLRLLVASLSATHVVLLLLLLVMATHVRDVRGLS